MMGLWGRRGLLLVAATRERLQPGLRVFAHEGVRRVTRCERCPGLLGLLPRPRRLKLKARVRLHEGLMSLVTVRCCSTWDT